MSQYSPTVQAVPFTGLGDAISSGLDRFLQGRQLKQQRDFEAYNTGFGGHVVDPTAPPPIQDAQYGTPPGGNFWDAIKNRVNQALGHPDTGAAARGTAVQQEGAAMATQQARSNTDQIRDVLSSLGSSGSSGMTRPTSVAPPAHDLTDALQAGQRTVLGAGSAPQYPNYSAPAGTGRGTQEPMFQLPSGQVVPLSMTPFGQRMRAAQVESVLKYAELQKDRAEADRAAAMADPEWYGHRAAAEAAGQAPYKTPPETPEQRAAFEIQVHRANRSDDAAHPVRGEGQTTDPYDKFAQPYINTRLARLMAPVKQKYGPDQPGMDFGAAYAQASAEAAQRWPKWQGGPSGAAPSAPALRGFGGTLQAHQRIDAQAKAAIAAGKDPNAVMQHAQRLHAQVEGPGRQSGNIDLGAP